MSALFYKRINNFFCNSESKLKIGRCEGSTKKNNSRQVLPCAKILTNVNVQLAVVRFLIASYLLNV